jgi:hypothetical protein
VHLLVISVFVNTEMFSRMSIIGLILHVCILCCDYNRPLRKFRECPQLTCHILLHNTRNSSFIISMLFPVCLCPMLSYVAMCMRVTHTFQETSSYLRSRRYQALQIPTPNGKSTRVVSVLQSREPTLNLIRSSETFSINSEKRCRFYLKRKAWPHGL